jgi:phospholipase/carboxylesterase
MKPLASTLPHIVLEPRTAGAERHPLLILIHGRGADEHDLAGLTDELDGRFLTVSVRAPFPFAYGGGFTWYEFDAAGTPDPAMFRQGYERLLQLLRDAITGYPVDPARVFLFGFSMGTVMAHAVALTVPALPAGIVANSGYVPEDTFLTLRWEALAGLDVLITHGTHDPVLPVQMGRRARELYTASAARLEYHEYAMGHEISEESLTDINRWLTRLLDTPSSPAGHG